MDKQTLTDNIRKVVWDLGENPHKIALAIGASDAVIYHWLDGVMPRADLLIRFMLYTGVTPNELFGLEALYG